MESATRAAPSQTAPRLKKRIGWLRAGYPGDAAPEVSRALKKPST
jgi:hypothetical protein